MSLGLVSPILNRGVRSRWVSTLPAGSKMLTIDAAGDVSYTDIPTAAWGSITGTLSSQTDLQNALDAKLSLSGGTMTGAINVPLGAAATESIRFASNTGIYSAGEGFVNLNASGMLQWNGAAGQLWLAVNSATTQLALGSSADVRIFRDAAAILAQRNGVNAQTFRVYNTFTDASNYERGQLAWESNEFRIGSAAAGTGTQRSSVLGVWTSAGVWHPSVVVGNRSIGDPNLWVTGSGGMIRMNRTGLVDMTLGEVNGDSFAIRNNGDSSVMFAVNATTKAATTYGQLTNALGTITASTPLTLTQTWNNAAVTFTGALVNVTDTASNASSLLMDLQVGGSSKASVRKDGRLTVDKQINSSQSVLEILAGGAFGISIGSVVWCHKNTLEIGGSADVDLNREAADTLSLRRSTNAQTFRVYNTYTDASNYERGKIEWSSNVLRIGTEKAGTGSARALELQTDGTTRLTIEATSGLTVINKVQLGTGGSNGNYAASINGKVLLRSSLGNGVNIGYIGDYSYWTGVGTSQNLTYASYQAETHFFTNSQYVDGEQALILKSSEVVLGKNTTCNGNLTLSTKNIVTDTTTGTKIGTATTQKIGFWNATPVVQPAAVADATDAASVITQLNLLLSRMRDLGLIAT